MVPTIPKIVGTNSLFMRVDGPVALHLPFFPGGSLLTAFFQGETRKEGSRNATVIYSYGLNDVCMVFDV